MDATYIFLQQYWWFLVSLLGALLVFLLFVQGGNSLLFTLGRTEEERTMLVNSTGRKWEFTFTTLVTFGGAFFASFPLFYSTSFGGAYWLWMIILFSFVLQAVSYEFQSKLGNLLGKRTYQRFLVLNGIVGPLLLGAADTVIGSCLVKLNDRKTYFRVNDDITEVFSTSCYQEKLSCQSRNLNTDRGPFSRCVQSWTDHLYFFCFQTIA